MIANIGLRLPDAQFSGISLNCDNFVRRHGVMHAFPLLAHIRLYGIFDPNLGERPTTGGNKNKNDRMWVSEIKSALRRLPVVWQCLRVLARCSREARHFAEGYRFLCRQDLLVVSGGGQLNEEYDGAWRHPFGLFKWAVLARIARVPYVVVSVGTGKIASTASRMFVSAALRMAQYRSYRDENSKKVVTRLLRRAAADCVVPDLAFSLPSLLLPPPASIRAIAQSRTVIAISPIAIGKPGCWPTADSALYERYLHEMAHVVSQLLRRGYFLVLVVSCLDEDEMVIPELLKRLGDEGKFAGQMHIPAIATWQEFVATLKDVDLLIASRLHSTILGFMSDTPTIAISSGAKVDSVMKDVGQTDYLLPIRNFTSEDVIAALERIKRCRDVVLQQYASYRNRVLPVAAMQYDTLAELAVISSRTR
jgi:polysaccharide pyruvyl transferase WcaK-like protein